MSAFPPRRTVPSLPVSQATALKHLQTYLEATKNSPWLLPNAKLDASGPTAAGNSISIHNLQRVEAGLRGEWLAPVLELGEKTGGVTIAQGMDDGVNQGTEPEGEGWQDPEEYARQQSIEEGEVAPKSTVLGQEGDEEGEELVEVEQRPKSVKRKMENGVTEGDKVKDKKARKEAKKLKLKEEKKKRAAEKLQQAAEKS